MDKEITADERRIIEVLEKKGWNRTEQGKQLGTANLAYDNGKMSLELQQDYGKREIILSLVTPDGMTQDLFVAYGTKLDPVLDAVVGFQDDVTPENFQENVRLLLKACPQIYVQEDEDSEPRLLTPD